MHLKLENSYALEKGENSKQSLFLNAESVPQVPQVNVPLKMVDALSVQKLMVISGLGGFTFFLEKKSLFLEICGLHMIIHHFHKHKEIRKFSLF